MTTAETLKLFAIIKTYYPAFYKGCGDSELKNAATLWADSFKDDDFEVVVIATKEYAETDTKGFPPVIGQIKSIIKNAAPKEYEMSAQEAWSIVAKAVDYYNYTVNYRNLPDIIRKVVGSAEMLREWSLIESPETWNVVASNFQRSYQFQLQRVSEESKYQSGNLKKIRELLSATNLLEEK